MSCDNANKRECCGNYSLILTDCDMPIMDGFRVIFQLRSQSTEILRQKMKEGELDYCPIVALTANVMKHDVDTYIRAGCDAYLAKPIDTKSEFRLFNDILRKTNY